MKYFLCFAVLLLAGFTNADQPKFSNESFSITEKHFNNDDYYTAIVASRLYGPLCSGAFIAPTMLVTAASCVARYLSEDLIVYTQKDKLLKCSDKDPLCSVTRVIVHPFYKQGSTTYNLAGLQVAMGSRSPQHLKILSPREEDKLRHGHSRTYIPQYTFDAVKPGLFFLLPKIQKVQTTYDLGKCHVSRHTGEDLRICVIDNDPLRSSVSFLAEGLPLVLTDPTKNMDYFLGLSGNIWSNKRKHFIFQAARGNYEFLQSLSGILE